MTDHFPYSPLKVYVAARWDDKKDAIFLKEQLEKRGILVTSTWLTPHDSQSMDALKASEDPVFQARIRAIKDFADIDSADVFLQYSPKASHRMGTGGKHVELGYAMAKGKTIVVLGERENVFHSHPMVRVVSSLVSFFRLLEIPFVDEGGEGTSIGR